jgi:ketosteroid isomerase-like protein
MSAENVEVVRKAWSAFKLGGPDAAFDDFYADDCVVEDFPELPDRDSYTGKQGAHDRNSNFVASWLDIVFEPIEFLEVGEDAVIVVVTMTGRGKESGAPLDAEAVFLHELRDGVCVRDRAFMSRSDALEAAGLSAA